MFSVFKKCILPLLVLLGVILFLPQQQFANAKPFRFLPTYFFKQACGLPGIGKAHCHAQIVTDKNGTPLTVPTPPSNAFGPVQFHTAYQLPCTPGGAVQSNCATPATFGPTIAIVDAYNDPTVEADLNAYSSAYGLPPCTIANGCLQVVDQNGGNNLPATDSGWALEISLDVQIAHNICQTCKILLVEASSSSISDLGTAVNRAASLGAVAISNSYGGSEFLGETNYDSYYNHPGVAITVSSGDSGYGTDYPAASPFVTAVGGTTLQLFSDNTYSGESVWNGSGSGCSRYESANLWQTSLSNWNLTGCSLKRAVADISADADPNTGAAVYDTTPYNNQSGWWIVGGTSLSSPLVASAYALAGGAPSNTNAASVLYANFPSGFHDITSGANGNCFTSMCKGATGYDGPTGLGSPNGLAAFIAGASATPTPTPTAGPTPTPTAVPTPTPTPIVDITAPVVSITSPVNGAIVTRYSNVTINATATDNVAVAKVEFYINGVLKATRTTLPYSYVWRVPGYRNHSYTLTAKAYDTSGNTATSSVNVVSSN